MMQHNWPHLYAPALVDVSDLADWLVKDQGGFYAQSEAACQGGRPVARRCPTAIVGLQMAYRKSWFPRSASAAWPKTWTSCGRSA